MRKAQHFWNYEIAPHLKLEPKPDTVACPHFFYMNDEEFDRILRELSQRNAEPSAVGLPTEDYKSLTGNLEFWDERLGFVRFEMLPPAGHSTLLGMKFIPNHRIAFHHELLKGLSQEDFDEKLWRPMLATAMNQAADELRELADKVARREL